MRLDRMRRSSNVEDARGQRAGGGGLSGLGGLGGGGRGGLKLGLGGIVLALIASWLLGIDPRIALGVVQGGAAIAGAGGGGAPAAAAPTGVMGAPTDAAGDAASAVLGDTEETWTEIFKAGGAQYKPPILKLFSGEVVTACGRANSGAGPFYCPGDQKVYIDLTFWNELETQFKAAGDFAQAYVIAHEVGHHIQTITGISKQVREARARADKVQQNQLQVMMELQADCYAGIWAHHAERSRQILEQGDIEEALAAASAVGDDTIQKRMRGYVQPESFTHGTAQQRMQWFKRGLETGSMQSCDTFKAGV
ncbi:MAG: neutral zinc metallopeptidase [Gammaproteobacteria bacterium]|jgi:predicted metalloprotease